jgi:hypothetical protein
MLTREDWLAVGELVRQRIYERTQAGVDATGTAFAPYSPGYALQKGRELLGVEASYSTVDLTVSGEMLRAITIEATDKSVELYFSR